MSISRESILDDLGNNRLPLPTLPEVAFKVRATADNENTTVTEVIAIIETDAALSARIIKVANSALYRGLNASDNIHNAVMRMGLDTTRHLTISLAMKQLFKTGQPVIDYYLQRAWKKSTDVAALSAMIAKYYTDLEPSSALLAGLTHSIGIAPILVRAETDLALLNDAPTLEELLLDLYPLVGSHILSSWNFNEYMVQVPAEHLDIHRTGNQGRADYTDVVQVALIQTVAGSSDPLGEIDLEKVSAMDRLGMRDQGIEEIEISGGIIEVEEIRSAIF